jgi:hypothetical protein
MQQCNPLENVTVRMPNGAHIKSCARVEIATNLLPAAARRVHVFKADDLTEYSLLSVNKLCQNGQEVLFNADHVLVQDATTKQLCLQGDRDPITGLYMVRLTSIGHNICNVYPAYNQKQMVEFAIATMGSPVTSSLLKAVAKKFVQIPGLTTTILRRHPHSKATAIGHLDLTRQGLSRTTLPAISQSHARTIAIQQQDDDDVYPSQPIMHDNSERKPVFVKTITLDKTYGDSTGRFPWAATSGAQYMLILYTEDANYIHVEPMHSRKTSEHIRAYGRALDFFKRYDIKPSLLRMDNEISNALEAYLVDTRQVPIQYVAPNNHRQNKAERIIRVWKNHFISILATTDPAFPMHVWEELLSHAELTINLLRASNTNTSISAWEHVRGPFVFQDTPITPPGTPVLVYESSPTTAVLGPRMVYLALAHYRCYTVFVPKTCKTRVTDTLS